MSDQLLDETTGSAFEEKTFFAEQE